MNPDVSVLMSVYNGEKYLKDAVESILSQTLGNFEFIIVDDGSADCTSDILYSYKEKDSRIVVIRNSDNRGLPYSLNIGATRARANFLARQDCDDISMPERLERQYTIMKHDEDMAVLGTACHYIDVDGNVFWSSTKRKFTIAYALKKQRSIFPHGSAMIRGAIFKSVGGYDSNFMFTQDLELWCRLHAAKHRLAYLPVPLYKFRVSSQINSVKAESQKEYTKYLCEKYLAAEGGSSPDPIEIARKVRERYRSLPKCQSGSGNNYWFSLALRASMAGRKELMNRYLMRAADGKNSYLGKMCEVLAQLSYYPMHAIYSAARFLQGDGTDAIIFME